MLLSLLLPRRTLVVEQVDSHLQRHRDEIYHFQQGLACTEEKMAYLSYEWAKEIWVRGPLPTASQARSFAVTGSFSAQATAC